MKSIATSAQDYRRQIARWTALLAGEITVPLEVEIPQGAAAVRIGLFTDGNHEKRCDKLLDQLDLLQDVVDGLEKHVEEYMGLLPPPAYDLGTADEEQFLDWFELRAEMTPELSDTIDCLRCRFRIETLARASRVRHIQFQEISSVFDKLFPRALRQQRYRLHLNPLRIWSRFTRWAVREDDDELPAAIVYHAVGAEIRTIALDESGREFVRLLELHEPCSL
ncbi:MAG TPA: hypothetical protein VHB77_07525, partial [Planctomycetaceae bacterium]|nr:hypothetical protein [Planctomycetaceae bacterium]